MLKKWIIFFLIMTGTLAVRSQTSEDLKKQQAEIQQEINELKQLLSATQKNKKAGLSQLSLIQRRLRLRQQAINNINAQIDNIQTTINQSRYEISRLKLELDTLRAQYEKSVVYAYKNRSNYDFLNFIFAATSFNDAIKRVSYLKSYRTYREEQAANILATQEMMKQRISNLEVSRKQKDEVLQKQEKEKKVLVEEKKDKDEVVRQLKSREKEINKELAAKARADRKLRDGIAAAIRREAAKEAKLAKEREDALKASSSRNNAGPSVPAGTESPKKSTSVFSATPEGEIVSTNFEKNRGRLPWPIDKGLIKIHYGYYSIEGTTIKGNNPGLTFETENGSVVKAVFEGDVISVFDIDGASAVLIRHGRYFTTYSGLASVSVSKGQQVKVGQMLGRAGANNDNNGEIEFVLMQDNRPIDPEPWIRRK